MGFEDVLKVVSVVLIPSIGAVVWLLREVYGLRGDLKELQMEIKKEREGNTARLGQLERSVERLADSVTQLTLIMARAGIDGETPKRGAANHG
jgi:hypothetical protein